MNLINEYLLKKATVTRNIAKHYPSKEYSVIKFVSITKLPLFWLMIAQFFFQCSLSSSINGLILTG